MATHRAHALGSEADRSVVAEQIGRVLSAIEAGLIDATREQLDYLRGARDALRHG